MSTGPANAAPPIPQSIDAWLQAVAQALQTTYSWDPIGQCSISPEGRPHPQMGLFFVAIDELSIAADGEEYFLRERYSIEITITCRAPVYPSDRREGLYFAATQSLTPIERKVITAINGNQNVRQAACQIAQVPSLSTGDDFQTALYYKGRQRTKFVDGGWIWADPDAGSFVTRALTFSGGLRVQELDVFE